MRLCTNDAGNVSSWATTEVAACIKTGIVNGRGNGYVAPKDSITRAECVTIIYRLLKNASLI
ncbi:MAG: S-layer homology domain-containing protein [Clostridia bacterium]|nr:S-layer homology domain-containing protein [Clostridia bacterium]